MDDLPIVTLQDNTSQRLPLVLLLDASGSMAGTAISELNEGLKLLEGELKNDATARQRVQLLVVRFGGDDKVETLSEWVDAMDFTAPHLTADGRTPMGEAARVGLAKLEEQKARYRSEGIPYNRPWIFMITDGAPTDENYWPQAAAQCRAAEQENKLIFFGIGVGPDADMEKLAQFSTRKPMRLQGLKFKELFLWLSASARTASKSAIGTTVQLPPADWGTISS